MLFYVGAHVRVCGSACVRSCACELGTARTERALVIYCSVYTLLIKNRSIQFIALHLNEILLHRLASGIINDLVLIIVVFNHLTWRGRVGWISNADPRSFCCCVIYVYIYIYSIYIIYIYIYSDITNYLEISLNQFEISLNELVISLNDLEISLIVVGIIDILN